MKRIEQLIVKDKRITYRIPLYKINGRGKGKTLMLIAGQHGGEWVGIEVIRRIFLETEPDKLRGKIIAIPVANPLAVKMGEQHFLFDQKVKQLAKHPKKVANKHCYNMNRLWPGKKDGTILEKVTATIWEKAVSQSDLIIDFHCYSRNNFHSVYISEWTKELGKVLNLGFLADTSAAPLDKTLSAQANHFGKKALAVEFVGAHEIIEKEAVSGVKGVRNMMKYLKMISGTPEYAEKQYLLIHGKTKNVLIKSPHCGFVIHHKKVLEPVKKGEVLCEIFDLESGKITNRIKSPLNGMVTHRRYINLVKKGELVVAVGNLGVVWRLKKYEENQ